MRQARAQHGLMEWQREGLTRFEDIGEALGISGPAAQLIFRQALKKLRESDALEEFTALVRLRRAVQNRQTYL